MIADRLGNGWHKKIQYMGNRNRTLGHAWAVISTTQLISGCAWTCLGPAQHDPAQHGPAPLSRHDVFA